MGACEHLLVIGTEGITSDPLPDAVARDGETLICPDCRAEGYTAWAHLRKCLDCGHVACCDSSPYRHASKHHEDTGHAVMRSHEPNETWRWCYVDRRLAP
ncbi:hypothetical protein Acsp06_22100 [Actinomycetospora sp. NBRC 106375]|uniref:UBP-type zinc finger domain-containing protein n=1 Tax=Actinomycetospora sp. NBRC 106375 TaxID=3032207 RepID=UPI0024A30B12|nr:UBP-type zinc finger domain-containing protein [Actinomycetospora sp. NBRC 106375]GLZ46025.1 hypothetical protein Acsp06_22100 [Actinomycetospora sp. NBRC 106375]